ncbi:hypothetical protein PR048_011388 [Dryococelus australis]|uniref:Uncharacterized protein n=1 Tax=Dryococelus australis TaxID=614101 RepID=A0ABQ9HLI8_9NEOP|nr:hypothetical protein PR048_011388 [Dryococelus australis]
MPLKRTKKFSTLHSNDKIDEELGDLNTPEIITFYNLREFNTDVEISRHAFKNSFGAYETPYHKSIFHPQYARDIPKKNMR